jgi:hypothetical protein
VQPEGLGKLIKIIRLIGSRTHDIGMTVTIGKWDLSNLKKLILVMAESYCKLAHSAERHYMGGYLTSQREQYHQTTQTEETV